MFKKKYYLICPTVGQIFTAQSCKIKDGFVIFDAINFQTRQKVNTQWFPQRVIDKIIEYSNWSSFYQDTSKLIAEAAELERKESFDRKAEGVRPKAAEPMTEAQMKEMIKQFPSQVPTVESMQDQLKKES